MGYIEELKELAKLKDDGIITEDEFIKKKEEILNQSKTESEDNPIQDTNENCPNCGEIITDEDLKNKTCPHCSLTELDEKIEANKNALKEELSQKILEKEKSEKLNINNTGLSEKYDVLETYKVIVYITMVLGTGFIIYSLKQFFDISEQYRDALQNQMIISLVSYIITMFSLYCITKMIDFLFDLDKKTDNNV